MVHLELRFLEKSNLRLASYDLTMLPTLVLFGPPYGYRRPCPSDPNPATMGFFRLRNDRQLHINHAPDSTLFPKGLEEVGKLGESSVYAIPYTSRHRRFFLSFPAFRRYMHASCTLKPGKRIITSKKLPPLVFPPFGRGFPLFGAGYVV